MILTSLFAFDTSYPHLMSGIYGISDSDTATIKELFSFIKDAKNSKVEKYGLETKDFVSFKNIDTIYRESSIENDNQYYNIAVKLNPTGRKSLYNLTKQCETLKGEAKYDGLLIGIVVKNTLLQISHVLKPIDTNLISISGSNFNKKTVDDIIEYLKDDLKLQ